jgi:sulfur relay (sulfurtransferase) complex TusBCD TusD component (DsrE family)
VNGALVRAEEVTVRLYLLGPAVELARAVPETPESLGSSMLGRLVSSGVEVAVSEPGLAARGSRPEDLIVGVQPSSGSTLASWTLEADRVLVF